MTFGLVRRLCAVGCVVAIAALGLSRSAADAQTVMAGTHAVRLDPGSKTLALTRAGSCRWKVRLAHASFDVAEGQFFNLYTTASVSTTVKHREWFVLRWNVDGKRTDSIESRWGGAGFEPIEETEPQSMWLAKGHHTFGLVLRVGPPRTPHGKVLACQAGTVSVTNDHALLTPAAR